MRAAVLRECPYVWPVILLYWYKCFGPGCHVVSDPALSSLFPPIAANGCIHLCVAFRFTGGFSTVRFCEAFRFINGCSIESLRFIAGISRIMIFFLFDTLIVNDLFRFCLCGCVPPVRGGGFVEQYVGSGE